MKDKLINGALFNASWLLIVMTHSSALAPVIVAVHLAVHFSLHRPRIQEIQLILGVSLAGFVIDQSLFFLGVFEGENDTLLAPLWFSCLWIILATTLCHAFSDLNKNLALGAALGAAGAWFSYQAGVSLTPLQFADPVIGPIQMATLWAAIFPVLLYFARPRLSGVAAG